MELIQRPQIYRGPSIKSVTSGGLSLARTESYLMFSKISLNIQPNNHE